MPFIGKRIVLALNSTVSALADDQFEYLPYDALVDAIDFISSKGLGKVSLSVLPAGAK